MSVSPVSFNGMIQRANDVGSIKQNDDIRPGVEQHSIQIQQVKKEDELTHKVVHLNQKDNEPKRYDAKEKGNGQYQKQKQKKKSSNQESAGDKVVIKGQSRGFGIKI